MLLLQRRCVSHTEQTVQARAHWLLPAAIQLYAAFVYRLMISTLLNHVIRLRGFLLTYRPWRNRKLSWPGWLSHRSYVCACVCSCDWKCVRRICLRTRKNCTRPAWQNRLSPADSVTRIAYCYVQKGNRRSDVALAMRQLLTFLSLCVSIYDTNRQTTKRTDARNRIGCILP